MIGVLLVTHGQMGQELLKCAEGIVGKQLSVKALGLDPAEGPDGFEKRLLSAFEELHSTAGVLVLSDMMGGTPCNVALRQCKNPGLHYELVTGVNLPILISALTNRHYMPLYQLAQKLVDDSPRNIVRPLQKLRELQP